MFFAIQIQSPGDLSCIQYHTDGHRCALEILRSPERVDVFKSVIRAKAKKHGATLFESKNLVVPKSW